MSTPMINPTPPLAPRWSTVVVRLATAADAPALERLAELDSARVPEAPVLLGTLGERAVAALSLSDGGAVADPFIATADVLDLLKIRAEQLRRAPAAGHRAGRRALRRWQPSGLALGRS